MSNYHTLNLAFVLGEKKNPFVWSDNGFPSDWLRSEFFFNVKYADTGLDYFEFVHSVR